MAVNPLFAPKKGESGYERLPNDAYFTESWVTEALLKVWRPRGLVWEPCCGDGRIVHVLRGAGISVVASDIKDYGLEGAAIHDFLETSIDTVTPRSIPLEYMSPAGYRHSCMSIVTNPPFDEPESFIQRAIDIVAPKRGTVAFLLRHEFDCANGRNHLFSGPSGFFCRVVLTKRPRWVANGTGSPRHNFDWYIWDFAYNGEPINRWSR